MVLRVLFHFISYAKSNGWTKKGRFNPNPKYEQKKEAQLIIALKLYSELNDKLKKYAQFLNVSDYEILLENFRKQRKLAKRIQELQYYRTELGLTKLSEIDMYKKEKEEQKLKRQCKRKAKKDLFVQLSNNRSFQTRNSLHNMNSSFHASAIHASLFATPIKNSRKRSQQQQQQPHTISVVSREKASKETSLGNTNGVFQMLPMNLQYQYTTLFFLFLNIFEILLNQKVFLSIKKSNKHENIGI